MPRNVKYIDIKSYALAMLGNLWLIDKNVFDRIGAGIASSFSEGVDEDIRDTVFVPSDMQMAKAIREGSTLELLEARQAASGTKSNGITAILPLYGLIEHKSSMMGQFMGGTSTESFGKAFDQVMGSPNVSSVVIDVDSPGGTVFGVPELADKIYNARSAGKPIVAQVNPYCASAATWIASSAHRIHAIPSAEAGSIGVYCVHTDMSQMLEDCGVKETVIKSNKSPFKAEFSSSIPLTDEGQAFLQEDVDNWYDTFASAVARNRGVDVSTVEKDFGMGRVMSASKAKKAGLIDHIASLEDTVARVRAGKIKTDMNAAEDDLISPAGQQWTAEDMQLKFSFDRRKNSLNSVDT